MHGVAPYPDGSNGTPVTIAIWSDPNGDRNPSDAVLLGSVAGTIQNANTNTFVTYTFSPPVTLPVAAVSFFVGDMTPANGPEYFPQALDQNSLSHRQSWYALMSNYGPVNLTNPGANDTVGVIFAPGNWLIRATALVTPTPTPPPADSRPPLWYNGDFDGVNGLANEQDTSLGAGQYAHTYDDFTVTDPTGWDVTTVFTTSFRIPRHHRRDLGNPPGNHPRRWRHPHRQRNDNHTTVLATGRSGFGYTEYTVEVEQSPSSARR